MKSSKTAIFRETGKAFSFEQVPVPGLKTGEILVRIEYTTLCRSDLNTYSGKRVEKTPTILGHEIVGRIEEMDSSAPATDLRGTALRIGDRITWAIYAADPESELAKRGIPQKADDLFKYGHERVEAACHLHGGLSEYCILRRHTPVVRVGESVPVPVAALINCSAATVAGSLRLAGSLADRHVLISGTGMLGIFACAMAAAEGAASVVATDIDPERLETAQDFGATETVNIGEAITAEAVREQLREKNVPRIDVVLDYSGVPGTMEQGLGLLSTGGTAVWVGATFPQRDLRINAEKVVRRIHTIRGLHNYNSVDLTRAVEFVEDNHRRFPFSTLISRTFSLERVNDAFDYALRSNAFRIGVQPGES